MKIPHIRQLYIVSIKALGYGYARFLEAPALDDSIVGINALTGQLIYSYRKMVEEIKKELSLSESDAKTWISYNISRPLKKEAEIKSDSLPPIIMNLEEIGMIKDMTKPLSEYLANTAIEHIEEGDSNEK